MAVAGGEDAEVDAGRHGGHLQRVRVVEIDQLRGLGSSVRDQPVSGSDDSGLADDATGRLWHISFSEQRVLDLGHRVHRVDQRHLPTVLREASDLSRQPVVRVDQVEVPRLMLGLDAQDAGREWAEQRRQVFLRHRLERASRDMPHQDARGQLDRGRQRTGSRPREDLDLHAKGSESTRSLDDVDVHAARVTGAGLVER